MDKSQKTDWRIERLFRAVALFDQLSVLEEAIERLKKHDWIVHEFNCEQFTSQEEFLNSILHQLGILKSDFVYKDIKMIQFWDLLSSAKVSEDSGLVLAFKNLDAFRPEYPEFFQELLVSLASEHHYRLMRRLRFMACVHLSDCSIKFEPLYKIEARWNEQSSFSEEADQDIERKLEEFKKWRLNRPRRDRQESK